jgi:hypothetical protein
MMRSFDVVSDDGLAVDAGDKSIQQQLFTAKRRVGGDGHLTASFEAAQEGPLRGHSRMGCLMIESE